MQSSLSPLKCKFGRFGETQGVFINSTTIRCTTPATDEPPDTIYKEAVTVSVSMNGQDFMEESSEVEFTFVGTAPYISFMTILLALLAVAFVGLMWSIYVNSRSDIEVAFPRLFNNNNVPNLPRANTRQLRDPNNPPLSRAI